MSMKEFVFADYIKIFKKSSRTAKVSYQAFLATLIESIAYESEYYVSSNQSSRIMSREYDVPKALRKAIFDSRDVDFRKSFDEYLSEVITDSKICVCADEMRILIQSARNIAEKEKQDLLNIKDDKRFLCDAFLFVVNKDNREIKEKCIWKNGNNCLKVVTGDLISLGFSKKKAQTDKIIVIPFDDKYHLRITGADSPIAEVSSNTLHGQWIQCMLKQGYSIDALKERIDGGIVKRYDNGIGSISKCIFNRTIFYLVAETVFDEYNCAQGSKKNIEICVNNILEEYNLTGQGVPLYIPLMGTGRSRVGFSVNQALNNLIEKCMEKKELMQGVVNIVVYTKDVNDLDMEEIYGL